MSRIAAVALMLAIASPATSAEPPKELTNSVGMKLVLIPAGEFMMGSPESEQDRQDKEQQHLVRIAKPYYLGLHEVTQAEYEKVMEKNPSCFSKGGTYALSVSGKDTSGFPVENVNWDDAVAFCKSLSTQDGKTYRLPSEAEWEYACRAGTATMWHCGDKEDDLEQVAWYRENSDDTTHPVGQKQANAWGLFDMHGNVWEWCQDWYGAYASDAQRDPSEPSDSFRVNRGGSWYDPASACRSANRVRVRPSSRYFNMGFRVALDP